MSVAMRIKERSTCPTSRATPAAQDHRRPLRDGDGGVREGAHVAEADGVTMVDDGTRVAGDGDSSPAVRGTEGNDDGALGATYCCVTDGEGDDTARRGEEGDAALYESGGVQVECLARSMYSDESGAAVEYSRALS